jgi:hypothetical protein
VITEAGEPIMQAGETSSYYLVNGNRGQVTGLREQRHEKALFAP